MKRVSPHPAPFSAEVLDAMRAILAAGHDDGKIKRVHDPLAGEGVRLGALCDEIGLTFSGTEIEAPFIIDPRVKHGDSTKRGTYPRGPFVIATSPVYPNGMADDFHAQDSSERRTYRSARAAIVGKDERLHQNNQARWGYRGTPLHSNARAMYWRLADKLVDCWGRSSMALVNVSDFYSGNRREAVVDGWVRTLHAHGFTISHVHEVETKRYRNGAGRANRVEAEALIIALPPKGQR